MSPIGIERISAAHKTWIEKILTLYWGSTRLVSRGKIYDGSNLPGFIAYIDQEPVGLCTYQTVHNQCEIISLNSLKENLGIGSTLITEVIKVARRDKCKRVWLITTNDNLQALGFYQKRGFVLVHIHPDAIKKSRQLKPEIPLRGQNDIPIRDELELELIL
ncbi:MAG: GNAT family N-acetyltransferase [Calditrichia bacterium]|nr:GNAT family N-acetyltransferase [Calditrichia bacterium]